MSSLRKIITGAFSMHPFYLRLSRNRISVRDSSNGAVWEGEPVAIVDTSVPGKKTIVGIGDTEGVQLGERINPFDHPRVLIHDFWIAERVLHYAIRGLFRKKPIALSPIVVLHVVDELEGGVTWIEYRALREALEGAGARKVFIWEGHELSDEELQQRVYEKTDGK